MVLAERRMEKADSRRRVPKMLTREVELSSLWGFKGKMAESLRKEWWDEQISPKPS